MIKYEIKILKDKYYITVNECTFSVLKYFQLFLSLLNHIDTYRDLLLKLKIFKFFQINIRRLECK